MDARQRQDCLRDLRPHVREIELEIRHRGEWLQTDVQVAGRTMIPGRLLAAHDAGVRDRPEIECHRRIGTAAIRQAPAGACGISPSVTLLAGLIQDLVPAASRAGAVRAARPRAGQSIGAVALLARLVTDTVAAPGRWGAAAIESTEARACRRVGPVALLPRLVDDTVAASGRGGLDERQAVAHGAVGTDHLQLERAPIDGDASDLEGGLGVGREAARSQRVEIVPPAAARDVDGARSRGHDLVGSQRLRALVVVLVPHEDEVHGVLVEERDEVGANGQVAPVDGAARIDAVVEGDEFPQRGAGREVVVQEGVLRAARTGALVAVDHREVRVAGVEGVVVRHTGRVVRRRDEEPAPGHTAGGGDVVVADRRPQRQPGEQVPVGHEELGVEAEVVHDVADVEKKVGGRSEHQVAHGVLIRAPAPGIPHHQEVEGHPRVVGPEDRLGSERHVVGERGVAVRATRREALHADFAHGGGAPAEHGGGAVGRVESQTAPGGRIHIPDDGDRMGRAQLEVRAPRERRGRGALGRGQHRQREQPLHAAPGRRTRVRGTAEHQRSSSG